MVDLFINWIIRCNFFRGRCYFGCCLDYGILEVLGFIFWYSWGINVGLDFLFDVLWGKVVFLYLFGRSGIVVSFRSWEYFRVLRKFVKFVYFGEVFDLR